MTWNDGWMTWKCWEDELFEMVKMVKMALHHENDGIWPYAMEMNIDGCHKMMKYAYMKMFQFPLRICLYFANGL